MAKKDKYEYDEYEARRSWLPGESNLTGTSDTPVPIRRCDHFAVRLACSPNEEENGNTEQGAVGFTVYDVKLDVVPGIGSRKQEGYAWQSINTPT